MAKKAKSPESPDPVTHLDLALDATMKLAGQLGWQDLTLVDAGSRSATDPIKDRLFDVSMQRFDALQPWREGVKAIARDIPFDPLTALCLGAARHKSMTWMLEMAGLSSAGLRGKARAAGLNMIMLSTLRIWLKDESQDMSVTMAHLDRQLSRADKLVQNLQNGCSLRKNKTQDAVG